MTVEEIEILVTAKTEEALKEFNKIVPAVKEKMKQVQDTFSKIKTTEMKSKIQQAVNFAKSKITELKKSTANNEIAIKVTNKDAHQQITQIQKEIDSLQKKINAREMQLNITNGALDKIRNDTKQSVINDMPNAGAKRTNQYTELKLYQNDNYVKLENQSNKLNNEIIRYNALLDSAKARLSEMGQETQTIVPKQNKLSSAMESFKRKITQIRPSLLNMKNTFEKMPTIGKNMSNVTDNVSKGITKIKGDMKTGLGQVFKYAGALLSLQGIYSLLSGCAGAWLNSQNAGAKQLSANIEYMKYAMGSALAPIIQFVTNLVYQLMKAIQSVVYALTGVNIFAKASANSYNQMAKGAKKAKEETKQLAGVHSEINNISDSKSNSENGEEGPGPSFDLSGIDNTPNSIIDAIKNGNWYEVGATIGQKLNDAMNSIPWDSIQGTAKSIGTNIARFLNGFIATTDWNQVGNTFAQGINTVIYFAYNFVTTFDWKQFGKAIGDSINGLFNNINWATAGQTLGEGIKGIFSTIYTALETIDWQQLARDLEIFIVNIDWSGVVQGLFRGIGAALGGLSAFLGTLISDAFNGIGTYFNDKIEECGGDVVAGIFKGIEDAIVGIGQWIYDNIFKPFIDGFKNAFGIHSPSTVMEEQGNFIIEGLKNGLTGIWDRVKQPFIDLKNNLASKFSEIKNNILNWSNNTKETISNWSGNVKSKISESWTNASNTVREKVNILKNNISTGLNNTQTTVSNWGNNIKNTFSSLGSKATTWGRDLVDNMASGIKNSIHKITSAVNSVAGEIKDYLHFTEPDVGPLSNFHTYMPDMIDLMVQGIRNNTSKVRNEIEDLASSMSYTINTDIISEKNITPNIKPVKNQSQNMFELLNDFLTDRDGSNSDRPIYLTVNVGNSKLGQILLDDLRDMKRRTGKDLEALVGG